MDRDRELDARIGGGKAPVDTGSVRVEPLFLGRDLGLESLLVRDALVQTLTSQVGLESVA